ncbi:Wadjet anti-phage system protein JetD domain-containing protein [Sporosarcina ureilytica]|uniref:Wadjet protein JetD C-terminal domain-containing protein n=1 Tax=Sporosarcina ureilytica TaxID=298596 RepID=A0A1D8JJ59_9BACL|nr:Wadjet anti-phage system protein JetD domain-containing protein [Sporosarcina ureilytica]AOV08751.1 hypothetical protein BI350_15170 [Sporosarcina ureilytica]
MDKQLNQLTLRSKVTITLEELSVLFHGNGQRFEELAADILKLEEENILQPVKSAGQTTRTPSVAYRYRINKSKLQADFHVELHRYTSQFHSAIRLDCYYSMPPEIFLNDLPFIERIQTYLTEVGFPQESVPAPERSAALVGDEKWIDEGGGREVLERIGLWNVMKIVPVSDPLMMAFNVKIVMNPQQFHLIVENKTTYQALLPILSETVFSTLIYGSGNKIVKSIEQFDWQFPIQKANHTFYYFGDIDRSGITIWNSLNEKRQVIPATPFYEACLSKSPFKGKTNQRKDIKAIENFVTAMPCGPKVESLLEDGHYYPQEVLKSSELREIWRNWSWNIMNGKA